MALPKPLAGRNAIVTGAARGIGLAIAQRLAREGPVVVMADIDRSVAAAEALRLSALGAVLIPTEVDVADQASVQQLAELVRERMGELHILVNNPATLDMTGIDALTLDHFERPPPNNPPGHG